MKGLRLTVILTLSVSVFFAYLGMLNWVLSGSLEFNLVANLLMGAAPVLGMGAPYRDYWDIYPPGIYALMGALQIASGGASSFFKLGHIFLILLMSGLVLWIILRCFTRGASKLNVVFFSIVLGICLNSYNFDSVFFSNVLIGDAFSILALVCILFGSGPIVAYGLSALLFSFAGQVKDPFAFQIFIPFLTILFWEKPLPKRLVIALIGTMIPILAMVAYLKYFGAIDAYKEVLLLKAQTFSLFERLRKLPLLSVNSFFTALHQEFSGGRPLEWAIIALGCHRLLRGYWQSKKGGLFLTRQEGILLLYVTSNAAGFGLQGRFFYSYALQMTPVFLLVLAFCWAEIEHIQLPRLHFHNIKWVLLACFICISLPSKDARTPFLEHPMISPKNFWHGIFMDPPTIDSFHVPENVKKQLMAKSTVQFVYGWDAPDYYYYMRVKPFSRFFILQFGILAQRQMCEYAQTYLTSLPQIVKYYSGPGAGMDVKQFEAHSIKLLDLLHDCYTSEGGDYYSLRHSSCRSFFQNPWRYIASECKSI